MPAPKWREVFKKSAIDLFFSGASAALAIASVFEDKDPEENYLYGFEAGLYAIGLLWAFYQNASRIEDAGSAYALLPYHKSVPQGATFPSWLMLSLGASAEIAMPLLRYKYDLKNVANVVGIVAPLITSSVNLIIQTGYNDLAAEAMDELHNQVHPGLKREHLEPLRRELCFPKAGGQCCRFFYNCGSTLNPDEIRRRDEKAHSVLAGMGIARALPPTAPAP